VLSLALQPFFKAGEVIMNQDCPDLVTQLLNHPVGKDDVPNALAFANKMRPGLPVYDNFYIDNILEDYVIPKTIAPGMHWDRVLIMTRQKANSFL